MSPAFQLLNQFSLPGTFVLLNSKHIQHHQKLIVITFYYIYSLSSIYIWIENSSPKSEASFNRADRSNRNGLELTSNSSFNFRHLGKECAEISFFDIDLKNNTMVL